MTIRFAAALTATNPAIVQSLCTGAPLDAANDNARRPRPQLRAVGCEAELAEDAPLADALMHFARWGLSAACQARSEAQAAHAAGNLAQMRHWLGICRHLDRRMAAATAKQLLG